MLLKIWRKLTTTLTGGAIIIATASVLSRVLGLVRDRLLAGKFGAGDELDTYYAAFRIPDLVFNVLVLGALSAAFIPVFVEYLQRAKENSGDHAEVWHLANSLLNILLVGLVVFGILFFIFAPQIVPLIAPGFDTEKQGMTVNMTRIMLVSIVFFGASNVMTGMLNSLKRYVSFALAPVMYNIGIILGIVLLVPRYGLYGLAYGVVLGSFLHFIVQIPGVHRIGYRYRPVFDWHDRGVRTIGKLMLPRTFGLAVAQVDQLISVIIGSLLAAGSVAVFTFANNLQSFPINVFGVSIAVASFPFFSEAFAQKNHRLFVQHFSISFRRILFVIIPFSVLILVLRAEIVRVVLGAGAFDWEDTKLTAQTLGLFALSLFAQSTIPLLARSFYAWQDTRTPVVIAIVSLVINSAGAIILSRPYGVLGLGLAFSIASFFQMILLLVVLRKRIGYLDDRTMILSVLKIITISAMAGAVTFAARYVINLGVNMQTFMGVLIQGTGAGCIGIAAYLLLAIVFKCDEITIITEWVRKARQQLFSNGVKKESSNGTTH
ncbi:MAG: murein biosynthesis integral membrane protein MurJ [Patescibacteria group bacterium]|nr:murein biosynthesis integral membrane protein MurJ [Patescibacteria group bacterium]MDD5715159.1 murein biosynthesis integral membrane protein MurJ [Patescibacteria group bacterium]